ncbi:MAG: hypothetical protein Kow00117_09280 [Phototrophicales bacterium]
MTRLTILHKLYSISVVRSFDLSDGMMFANGTDEAILREWVTPVSRVNQSLRGYMGGVF